MTIILLSMFGILSVRRILNVWSKKKLIPSKNKLQIDLFLLFAFLFLIFHREKVILIISIFALLSLLALFFPFFIEFQRKNQFRMEIISALDAILLSIRSGNSLRESLAKILTMDTRYGYYIREIISLILLRQSFNFNSRDKIMEKFYIELKNADQSSHRVADRIKSFRYLLKMEENFRQKSRIATMQARAQSLVVSFLYFGALIYDFIIFSKNLDKKVILLSLILFTAGTFWIWNLGRRHKWTV